MRDQFLLNEVVRVLGRKAHQVVHAIVSGQVPEPEVRIGNRRVFSTEDVVRLARHFRVTPNWDALRPVTVEVDADPPAHLSLKPPYEVVQVGETGHEIKDGDGEVFAWASDRAHALMVAALLEGAARG